MHNGECELIDAMLLEIEKTNLPVERKSWWTSEILRLAEAEQNIYRIKEYPRPPPSEALIKYLETGEIEGECSYSRCNQTDVETSCKDMLARIGGGFKFHEWIDLENKLIDVDFAKGLHVVDHNNLIRLQLTTSYVFWTERDVYTNSVLQYYEYGKELTKQRIVDDSAEVVFSESRTIKDAHIHRTKWRTSGINFVMFSALNKISKI